MNKKGDKNFLQRIKEVSRILFWENKVTMGLIYTSIAMNLLVWTGFFLLIKRVQGILIGHYNVFFGIDVLINTAEKSSLWKVFLPSIGGLFFLVLSILMSIFLILQLDRTAVVEDEIEGALISNKSLSFIGSRLLLIGAWLVQLIIIVCFIAIWRIN